MIRCKHIFKSIVIWQNLGLPPSIDQDLVRLVSSLFTSIPPSISFLVFGWHLTTSFVRSSRPDKGWIMYFPTSEQTSMQPEWQISLPSEPGHESTSASFSFFFLLLPPSFFSLHLLIPEKCWCICTGQAAVTAAAAASVAFRIWRVTSSTPSFFRLSLINLSHFDTSTD